MMWLMDFDFEGLGEKKSGEEIWFFSKRMRWSRVKQCSMNKIIIIKIIIFILKQEIVILPQL